MWAFGCVLYEMLTGRPAFPGDDVTEILANVVKGDPDWSALPPGVPPRLRTLLVRCLQKDPRKRIRNAGDVAIEIEEALAPSVPERPESKVDGRGGRNPVLLAVAGLLAGLLIGAVATWRVARTPPPVASVARLTLTLPAGQRLGGLRQTGIALSPDGKRLAYVARAGGPDQIYVREIDSLAARPLTGTEDAENPFFSPDGQWIGFFTADSLKKVAASGGPTTTLALVDDYGRGGSWGADGNIVFSPGPISPLSVVSSAGGSVRALTRLGKGETSHRHPHHLPGGALLLTVSEGRTWDEARIEHLSRDGTRKILIQGGSDPHYATSGHVVYLRAGALMAAPFDPKRIEVIGSAVPVVEGVLPPIANTGSAEAALADSGLLLYVSGEARAQLRVLVSVDRQGSERSIDAPPRAYDNPRLSLDGKRLLISVDEGNFQNVWIHDLVRGTLNKFTGLEAGFGVAVWTPDAAKVIFQSTKAGSIRLAWKNSDGSGADDTLNAANYANAQPDSISPDGRTLTYTDLDPATRRDIWVLSLSDRRKTAFLQTAANESNSALSPDGRWIAYQSDRSGRDEVYVQPFPGPGAEELISTGGGDTPIWSRNGRELFYRDGDKMMAVAITSQPAFAASKPQLLFEKPYYYLRFYPAYDVAPDGTFIMIKEDEQIARATVMQAVLHWTEELKQRVPTR